MAETATYRYDLFISHSPQDESFALDWLLPRLKQAGLIVATREESFRPGVPELNETERCIAESRRIVALLSEAYVAENAAEFEGLLVQQRDPAARLRRLIPVKLEACEPPGRIALLGALDMTDPDRREGQLARLIAAVQGRDELPEIRYERIPDAQTRWWELRWFQVAGVASLLTLLLVAWFIWSQRPPPPPTAMPDNSYNIALAPFAPTDPNDSAAAAEGRGRADEIAGLLKLQVEELSQLVNRPVAVWGPEDGVPPIAATQVETDTAALNADLLIYGTIEQASDGNWQLEPNFYLSDRTAQNVSAELAGELQGSHALGRPISYSPSAELQGDANAEIQRRIEALRLLVRGLLYYAQESEAGYERALGEFQAATQTEWGQAEDGTGQEILYYFLGGAHLQKLTFIAQRDASPEEQKEMVFSALDAYEWANALNPNYLRGMNGEAEGYVQLARLDMLGPGSVCNWNFAWLEKAEALFEKVLNAPDSLKQPGNNTELIAWNGIGRIAFTRSFCKQADEWAKARSAYDAAIALYEAERRPSQMDKAIVSYRERGHVDFFNPNSPLEPGSAGLEDVINYYRSSVEVGVERGREESLLMARDSMSYLLEVLCQDDQLETIQQTVTDFLVHFSEPEPIRAYIVKSTGFSDRREDCYDAITH